MHLLVDQFERQSEWRYSIRDYYKLDCWIRKNVRGASHEQSVCNQSQYTARPMFSGGACCSQECPSRADQIINNESSGPLDVTDEEIA